MNLFSRMPSWATDPRGCLDAGVRAQEIAFAEGRGPDPATTNVDTPTGSANTLAAQAGEEDDDPLQ